MIKFDFSAIYMAIIASNILLVIISLLILNRKILHNVGYRLLSTFLILTTIRFLLPLDFGFTMNVSLPEVISKPLQVIYKSVYSNEYIDIQIWTIIFVICLLVSIIRIILLFKANSLELTKILITGKNVTMNAVIQSSLAKICKERNIDNIFQVYQMPNCPTPYTMGIFRPYIILPESLQQDDELTYYVLSHEINHYIHRDLLLKFGVQILCHLYWWNPFSYLLVKQSDLLIEMRIDDKVISAGDASAKAYIRCLHYVSEMSPKKKKRDKTTKSSFGAFCDSDYIKRVYALANRNAKKNYLLRIIVTILVLSFYCASYMYIFEADYNKPDDTAQYMELTTNNMYIIDNKDGTYDVYYGSIHAETVTSIEHFHKDVKVYTREDFSNEIEKH